MAVIAFIEAEDVIEKILKHLGLWELTPTPPPRMAKTQHFHTEPHIDYSHRGLGPYGPEADKQVPPSEDILYHLAFTNNSRYVFGVEERIAPPFCFKRCSDLSC
jgi:hypothetical protein